MGYIGIMTCSKLAINKKLKNFEKKKVPTKLEKPHLFLILGANKYEYSNRFFFV